MAHQPTLRKYPEGRTVAVVGDVYRFLATGEDTNGKYAMWEAIVPPGGGPPPHVHSWEEEGFYILEGEITFEIGGERLMATPGTFANMPIGTTHSFKNESDRPARMLIVRPRWSRRSPGSGGSISASNDDRGRWNARRTPRSSACRP
jgi:quercetin dioxygenase-like cupin family protein